MDIKIIYETDQEISLKNDTFFDYNAFLPAPNPPVNDNNKETYPIKLGIGVHSIILDKLGNPRGFHIDKKAKIKITLEIGYQCMVDSYSNKIKQHIVTLDNIKLLNDKT